MTIEIERGLVKTSAGYVHFRAAGRGKPILLLHINQQSSALFLEMLAALGRDMRAIAIDYPSHGMSDHVTAQPSIADYARWIVEVMDAAGLEKAAVLGEAVGATIAIELSGAYPQRIEKLVLVNCPFHHPSDADKPSPQRNGSARPADSSGFPLTRTIEHVLEHNPQHAPMHPTQSWMDRVNLAQIETGRNRWQGLDAINAYNTAAGLARVRHPALLLIGEHFLYRKFRHEFTSRLEDLRVEIVAGGRFCLTWERAEEIAAKAMEFLRPTRSGAPAP
jgi:pimeloyl-ACP methyl ester carboxylesterase